MSEFKLTGEEFAIAFVNYYVKIGTIDEIRKKLTINCTDREFADLYIPVIKDFTSKGQYPETTISLYLVIEALNNIE